MFKTAGVIFVLVPLGIFMFNKVENKKEKYQNLCEMKRALAFLRHEMSFSAPELFLICQRISDETTGEISKIFHKLHNQLKEEPSTDFGQNFCRLGGDSLFPDSVKKVILDFTKSLGKKSLDIEIENIAKTEKALETAEIEEKEKFLKERKLIYTLGIASGAVILILTI